MNNSSHSWRPLQDRLIIERVENEERKTGGIIIPDTSKEKPSIGIVLAAGPGARSEKDGSLLPMDVKVGDKVLFGKWSGTEIDKDNKKLVVMKQSDILAICEA